MFSLLEFSASYKISSLRSFRLLFNVMNRKTEVIKTITNYPTSLALTLLKIDHHHDGVKKDFFILLKDDSALQFEFTQSDSSSVTKL